MVANDLPECELVTAGMAGEALELVRQIAPATGCGVCGSGRAFAAWYP